LPERVDSVFKLWYIKQTVVNIKLKLNYGIYVPDFNLANCCAPLLIIPGLFDDVVLLIDFKIYSTVKAF